MAARSKAIEVLTKSLIHSVTGFEEDDENFHISYDFVASNFKYHKFLDTDAFKVKRIVEGMREKFVIHSQDEKANAFMESYERFLKTAAFEGKESGYTETHFAVLHFLLLLADSPTKAIYDKSTPASKANVSKKTFDWATYLREDDVPLTSYADDETASISEEEEDDGEEITIAPSSCNLLSPKSEKSVTFGKVGVGEHSAAVKDEELKPRHGSRVWFYENLIARYWLGESFHVEAPTRRSSSLIYDWDRYESQVNPLYAPMCKTCLTEYQIIREIIWLLIGGKDLFVFRWNGSSYHPNIAICVGHLTEGSLVNFLEHISHYGNIVYKFNKFVDSVANDNSCHSSTSSPPVPTSRTYQAFGSALFEFLQQLRRRLVKIEKKVCEQDETVTISSVERELSQVFQSLLLLDSVFTNGIESCDQTTNQSQKALTLLGVLHQMLTDFDRQNLEERKFQSLLLFFWIKTCRPYIELIDSWMFKGFLNDPSNEFIIQRNKDIQSSNENFWNEAFTFACELSSFDRYNKKPKGFTEEAVSSVPVTNKASVFLLPVIREIILTGKSVELLKSLGRIKDVIGTENYNRYLYTKYVEGIKSQFFSSEADTEQLNRHEEDSTTAAAADSQKDFDIRVEKQLYETNTYDPLLRQNFDQLFDLDKRRTTSSQTQTDSFDWFSASDAPMLVPLQWTLQTCLYSHLLSQYRLVSSTLLQILKEEHKLLDYLAAIRRFYLMEAGGAMYEFYTAIFDRIRLGEVWKDVSFVNAILQDVLQFHHHHDRERAFLTFREGEDGDSLDDIILHYKISWPIDIVITSRHMAIYNRVFLFLLRIKHAKYILDRLQFSDLVDLSQLQLTSSSLDVTFDSKHRSSVVHRLHMFRMRLLHFVNSIHNYIMTRILHLVGIEFQADMNSAVDLDEIISTHNAYVQVLHERCMFHQKVSLIREMIVEVLDFAKTVEGLWKNDNGPAREVALSNVEDRFKRCITFLSSMVQKVTTRGTFPHLESLAFALVTCRESLRQAR